MAPSDDDHMPDRKIIVRLLRNIDLPPGVTRELFAVVTRLEGEKSRLKERLIDHDEELTEVRGLNCELTEKLEELRADRPDEELAEARELHCELTGKLKKLRADRQTDAEKLTEKYEDAHATQEMQIRGLQQDLAKAAADRWKKNLMTQHDHATEVQRLTDELTAARDDHEMKNLTTQQDHAMEIQRLTDELTVAHDDQEAMAQLFIDELEHAHTNYSGDDIFVMLYHAGTRFITKQTAEIKSLKAEVKSLKANVESQKTEIQHGKDEHERQKSSFTLKMAKKDNEKAILVEDVQRLKGCLTTFTRDFTNAEADLKRILEAAAERTNSVRGNVATGGNGIDDLRRSEGATAKHVELLQKLRKVEERCRGYRSTAAEQKRLIEQLSEENTNLVRMFGRYHVDRGD